MDSKQPQAQPMNLAMTLASVMSQIGCLVLVVIGLALGAGILLDNFLETDRIFTAIFIIGSFPVTIYLVLRLVMRAQKQLITEANKTEDIPEA